MLHLIAIVLYCLRQYKSLPQVYTRDKALLAFNRGTGTHLLPYRGQTSKAIKLALGNLLVKNTKLTKFVKSVLNPCKSVVIFPLFLMTYALKFILDVSLLAFLSGTLCSNFAPKKAKFRHKMIVIFNIFQFF
jgi:hypothetical protein